MATKPVKTPSVIDTPKCPLTLIRTIIGITDSKQEGKENSIIKEEKLTDEQRLSIGAMSSLFATSNTVYSIRLTRSATLTTSGGGTMALATPVHPSQFDQYTQLSALFNKCRLLRTRIQLSTVINPNSSSSGSTSYAGATFACAFNPRAGAGASPTTSTSECIRTPGCKIYSPCTLARPLVLSYKFPRGQPWSIVSANSGSSDPIGGVSGYWINCALTTATASTTYMLYLIEAEYEFSNLT